MISSRTFPIRLAWRAAAGGALAMLILLGIAAPASAHPYFLRSTPPAGSVAAAGLDQIQITYTEALDLPYCKVTLVGSNGQRISTTVGPGSGGASLTVTPQTPIRTPGTYAVEWTAVGADGHTVFGAFPISVGHVSANPAVTASGGVDAGSAGGGSSLDEILRAVLPGAVTVLAGLLLMGPAVAAAAGLEGEARRRARVGRRMERLRAAAWALTLVDLLLLSRRAFGPSGPSAFTHSRLGHVLLVQLVIVVAGALVLADRGALREGCQASRTRRWSGAALGLALLISLADSSHAATAQGSLHVVALAVYSVHLLAVSIWIGAIATVVVPVSRNRPVVEMAERVHRSRRLVGLAVVAVLGTGLATTAWGLRSIGELTATSYGDVISTKMGLFVLMVSAGLVSLVRPQWVRRLAVWEAGSVVVVLVLAGILGQLPQPIDLPVASQVFAQEVGLPVQVTPAGGDLLVGTVTPAVVGSNSIVVRVEHPDSNDFLQPVAGRAPVSADLSCGCGAADRTVVLHPNSAGWWTGTVDLPEAATWSAQVTVEHSASSAPDVADLTAQVSPVNLPDQAVIGVVAGLSGDEGQDCQDEMLGVQAALADANTQGYDHGDLMRVIAVDSTNGVGPAFARLAPAHPELIVACGDTGSVDQTVAAAHRLNLPVVAPFGLDDATPGVWGLSPNWAEEGQAVGEQAVTEGADAVTVVAGSTPIDQTEVAGTEGVLRRRGVPFTTVPIEGDPSTRANQVVSRSTDCVIVLADPNEASGLIQSLSTLAATDGWLPSHGLLASDQLMDTDFIDTAGQLTRVGAIEFASDIDPFDPLAQYYAQRLTQLYPGIRPSFVGLHGYDAAWLIAQALARGGGRPSAATLTGTFATKFNAFEEGSYHGSWTATGGGATQVSFFRSTYINPMAMPSFTPGGAQALSHEGTFLDTGGFEQVTPFRSLS